ncbi:MULTISPECIES: hypothetical protein [Burkholderia cepacia complex]|uniref:hypothetical protein n=1 Tax=Burkholderia cepacia complex TaxID=87882 RepID=UPI0015888E2E|nr:MULTISPECIES: hypothetical protein [Burkholderia cepacia complex]MCA7941730.1 hypothetical protein [Burkholderia cepacia]
MATSIVAHWSRRATNVNLHAFAVAAALLAPAAPAHADGWGCQVLLCLSDPRGPEHEGECVPPIEKLWDHLAHGNPFPTCDLMESWDALPEEFRRAIPDDVVQLVKSTTITGGNGGASGSFCPYDLMYYSNLYGPACRAHSVIQVKLNGQVFTRVWWNISGGLGTKSSSRTEYFGGGSTTPFYDPAESAKRWIDDQENNRNGNGSNGSPSPWFGLGNRH